jgi:hypothetical protein
MDEQQEDQDSGSTRRETLANAAVLGAGAAPMAGWGVAILNKARKGNYYTSLELDEGDTFRYTSELDEDVYVSLEDSSDEEVTLGIERDGSYAQEVYREGKAVDTDGLYGEALGELVVKDARNKSATVEVRSELNPEMLE